MVGSYRNLGIKFNDFSMTFPWPFQAVMAGIILEKSNEMHHDLPSFFGATSYIRFTMTNLWIKHIWKACKIFANFLIATYLEIVVKRHMIIIYQKCPTSSNWYFSMTFTDFQWLFKAKCNFSRPTSYFHDFSRQDWNSMTFPGLYEPWYHSDVVGNYIFILHLTPGFNGQRQDQMRNI